MNDPSIELSSLLDDGLASAFGEYAATTHGKAQPVLSNAWACTLVWAMHLGAPEAADHILQEACGRVLAMKPWFDPVLCTRLETFAYEELPAAWDKSTSPTINLGVEFRIYCALLAAGESDVSEALIQRLTDFRSVMGTHAYVTAFIGEVRRVLEARS